MSVLAVTAPVPTTTWYLVLGAVLFGIGAVGVLVRRNPLVLLMCIELMLNAVNLSFVALSRRLGSIDGQTAVFFILVVAAAEAVVGLGIIVAILRRRPGATADDLTRAARLTLSPSECFRPTECLRPTRPAANTRMTSNTRVDGGVCRA